jgi:hypothetical protein
MTTKDERTTIDMSSAAAPAEAAALLEHLQQGAQDAWRAAAQAAFSGDGEYESRRDTAVDVDEVFRDAMWQTFESGLRHPGEDVTAFARRVTEPDPEAGQ